MRKEETPQDPWKDTVGPFSLTTIEFGMQLTTIEFVGPFSLTTLMFSHIAEKDDLSHESQRPQASRIIPRKKPRLTNVDNDHLSQDS
jgi:hypothetical protein